MKKQPVTRPPPPSGPRPPSKPHPSKANGSGAATPPKTGDGSSPDAKRQRDSLEEEARGTGKGGLHGSSTSSGISAKAAISITLDGAGKVSAKDGAGNGKRSRDEPSEDGGSSEPGSGGKRSRKSGDWEGSQEDGEVEDGEIPIRAATVPVLGA